MQCIEQREFLIFARFGIHGSHGSTNLRKTLLQLNSTTTEFSSKYTNLSSLVIPLSTHIKSWQSRMLSSTFCLCPSGDTPSTRRFFNSALAGCLPIIYSNELVLPWKKTGQLKYDWMIKVDASGDVLELTKKAIEEADVVEMRRRMIVERERFVYYEGDDDWKNGAWGIIEQQLIERVKLLKITGAI